MIWWPVAAWPRARGRVDVDCRVDQDKGLISIVENKLAASSQEEGERGAAAGARALAIACNMGGGGPEGGCGWGWMG